jgi:putative protease
MAKPELLAPAGDFERLRFALAYGADAVYAGQPQFSLRSRENGFTTYEEVAKGIAYCHERGKKFYLASNIIPHNNKIRPFQESLAKFIALKPDALIMTDPGMIQYVRQNFPEQEVHLSVQANCTNWSTAKFWYDLGITRIILSRELKLREITQIQEEVAGLELEVFVHGAICMAYSGRCMLSNYMSYRDANQGMCSNACRFQYGLYAQNKPQDEQYVPLEGQFFLHEKESPTEDLMPVDEDEYGTYFMNSKDMCAIDLLKPLWDAGIASFKIEGRTKSIYYLSQVVSAYRGAIDDLAAEKDISETHKQRVYNTDSRGYIPGFFIDGNRLPQNYETTKVAASGSKVAALIRAWDPDTKEALISVKGAFHEGETLELMQPGKTEIIKVSALHNHKGKKVERLNPGMENCRVHLDSDPGEFAFLCSLPEKAI